MKSIFLTAAHGSAGSLVKSLLTQTSVLSAEGTCHESWKASLTSRGDKITFQHYADYDYIAHTVKPDMVVWLQVNDKNIDAISQRIVYLDFVYANDPEWIKDDMSWTTEKHNRLAGASWPSYSANINDYPVFCRTEMCEVARQRILPWASVDPRVDYVIDSDELFGNTELTSLTRVATALECNINLDFLNSWKQKNQQMFNEYRKLFNE